MRARVVKVLVNEWNEGDGSEKSPIHRVYAIRTLDGEILFSTSKSFLEGLSWETVHGGLNCLLNQPHD